MSAQLPYNIVNAVDIIYDAIKRSPSETSNVKSDNGIVKRPLDPNYKNKPTPVEEYLKWEKEIFRRGRKGKSVNNLVKGHQDPNYNDKPTPVEEYLKWKKEIFRRGHKSETIGW